MRITDIHIERFGSWSNLHLTLPSTGLNVLYGPNEAGKSTLLRFTRAVMYGTASNPPLVAEGYANGSTLWSGALVLEHEGKRYRWQRRGVVGGHDELRIVPLDDVEVPPDFVEQVLNGVDEAMFQKVFAVGLREVQELSTLQAGEVADRIHGLTLGPEGQQLVRAGQAFREQRQQLVDPLQHCGRLVDLFTMHDELTAELRQTDKRQRQHRELCRDRALVEAELHSFEQRQAGLEHELRGLRLLQRVWGPWNRVRKAEEEYDSLDEVAHFPENGVLRLEQIERDLGQVQESRRKLLSLARQAKEQANRLRLDKSLKRHLASVQGLLDQRDWITQVESKVTVAQQQADDLKAQLNKQLEKLGPPWNLKRLEAFDASPGGHFRLLNMGRSFRKTLGRRARCERSVKRFEQDCTERTVALQNKLQSLQCDQPREALELTRRQLVNLERIRDLKLRVAELEQRLWSNEGERERLENHLVLPPWVYVVMFVFAVLGLGMMSYGLKTGMQLSLVVGVVYALLIFTCGGLCLALKTHFEQETQERLAECNREGEKLRRELHETKSELQTLMTPELMSLGNVPGKTGTMFAESELIQRLSQRASELQQASRDEQRLLARRRKLTERRQQLQGREKDVGAARQSWQDYLTQQGLPADLRVDEACDYWQELVVARNLHEQHEQIQREHQQHREIVQAFLLRIIEIGRRMHQLDLRPEQAWNALRNWEQLLQQAEQGRRERVRLIKEARHRAREAQEYVGQEHDLKTQRAAVLVQGGAADRDEFLTRADLAKRRLEVGGMLQEARHELALASDNEFEIALVQEDLEQFNPAENQTRIQVFQRELEDLRAEISETHEQLGGLKHEIRQLEDNRESTHLRYDRERIAEEILDTLGEWAAVELAGQSLERLRGHFERNCQPVVLADASRYLSQLTCGRYRNVWTPLGERHLCIDDEFQNTLNVEQLSRGTCEQLFLAIRLALVDEVARQGTRLPMVLDDVLVNYDQDRAEAAVEVLREFCERGHQVLLFTCHQHLAERAEALGLEATYLQGRAQPKSLPAPSTPPQERLAG